MAARPHPVYVGAQASRCPQGRLAPGYRLDLHRTALRPRRLSALWKRWLCSRLNTHRTCHLSWPGGHLRVEAPILIGGEDVTGPTVLISIRGSLVRLTVEGYIFDSRLGLRSLGRVVGSVVCRPTTCARISRRIGRSGRTRIRILRGSRWGRLRIVSPIVAMSRIAGRVGLTAMSDQEAAVSTFRTAKLKIYAPADRLLSLWRI
jgi:hypothetical protein